MLRARDAYLEPLSALAPADGPRRLVHLAGRTGCVGKALAYRAALEGTAPSVQAEAGFPMRAWLLELLDQRSATGSQTPSA